MPLPSRRPSPKKNLRASVSSLPSEANPRQRMPSLPPCPDEDGWHPLTLRFWKDVWQSPMSQEYVRADEYGLFMLAMLVNRFWGDPSAKLSNEIRQRGMAYGLSPIDRRKLEWSIEKSEEAQNKRVKRSIPVEDPRNLLE